MSSKWPAVRLEDVLSHLDTSVPVDQLGTVDLAGVYSFGRGLFKRGELDTGGTSYKKYNRLHAGDFVISQPKAWEGALALVTDEFDGWFLSPVFPTFRCDRSRLDPLYLSWWSKQEHVWARLLFKSRGIGARRESVSPTQFLSLTIPLPPLSEQRRLVGRIEAVAGLVAEASRLREEVAEQQDALLRAAFSRTLSEAQWLQMKEVAPLIRRQVEVQIDGSYAELGIRSFGRGTFHKPTLSGFDIGSKRIFSIEPGDLMFSNVFAWEGAIAVAKQEDMGRVGSHRFITCVPEPELALANYLCFYFLTDDGMEKIQVGSPGGAGRNRTLGITALGEMTVPVPSLEVQRKFVTLLAEVDALKALQAETQAELDALLPAVLAEVFGSGRTVESE